MLLNDRQIVRLCMGPAEHAMVKPFSRAQVTRNDNGSRGISFGLSSVGYDIRLASSLRMFRPTLQYTVIDPKHFNEAQLLEEYEVVGGHFDLPPHGYALGVSMERFQMPETVAAICLTKSTYARCGLLLNTTPLEPGWTGHLTLEIANLTDLPIRVYTGEGIAQVLFFEVSRPDVTYNDRKGKYMDQPAKPVSPKVLP